MAQTMTEPAQSPPTTKLWLRSYDDSGFTYRHVSTRPPRDCTPKEIPMINLASMFGNLAERKALATEVLQAAESSGFFYIKNHGVPESAIGRAHEQAKQ